ncbi:hypothetical protein KJ966_00530 [bacterium]|nr:hypothetical protein [bacterium]
MGTEIIARRRLYDALGCGFADKEEISFSLKLVDEKMVFFYLGSNPQFGVTTIEADKYGIPGKKSNICKTKNDYKSDCFFEIVVTTNYNASDELSEGIANKDPESRNKLLKIIETQAEIFSKILDAIAGIIGLKFHRQFVLKQLIESSHILSGPEPVASFAGPALEVLQPITIKADAQSKLENYLQGLSSITEEKLIKGGSIFHWLIKAWQETDPATKFVYLFIPLEGILQSNSDISNDATENISLLEDIVKCTESEHKERLMEFLKLTKQKFGPNLNMRFEQFAKQNAIPGWEADVKAFKKFNRMRNLLVHAGKKEVQMNLDIKEETRTLEDLVERYLGVTFLRSHDVYQSRWRPIRNDNA